MGPNTAGRYNNYGRNNKFSYGNFLWLFLRLDFTVVIIIISRNNEFSYGNFPGKFLRLGLSLGGYHNNLSQ